MLWLCDYSTTSDGRFRSARVWAPALLVLGFWCTCVCMSEWDGFSAVSRVLVPVHTPTALCASWLRLFTNTQQVLSFNLRHCSKHLIVFIEQKTVFALT